MEEQRYLHNDETNERDAALEEYPRNIHEVQDAARTMQHRTGRAVNSKGGRHVPMPKFNSWAKLVDAIFNNAAGSTYHVLPLTSSKLAASNLLTSSV